LRIELVGGLAFAAIAVVLFAWAVLTQDSVVRPEVEGKFPVKAVAFLKEQGYSGPVFNHFGWGGYLIWSLPELPVSIDGRTNLYGDPRVIQVFRTAQGFPGWNEDPNLAAANVILVPRAMALQDLLGRDRRFEKVYEDHNAVVFLARR
jgi:hypothetical protein